jgi:uncharacterized BrkB/YihY/UPF0761 family membrane protein
MLVGVALLTAISALTTITAFAGAGLVGELVGWALAIAVHFALFAAAYTVLTSTDTRWTAHLPGAAVAAVARTVLLRVGGTFVARQIAHANEVYGTFALVVGLLAWLYLGSSLALIAAEINVVRAARLWPRTIVPPPLGEPDRRALVRFAEQGERRPEVQIDVRPSSHPAGQPPA